ncbi:DUF4216 domain-containing protein [Salmonella enterica]|nr:DUF4216 domain-containing protein [Salmonella enterica]
MVTTNTMQVSSAKDKNPIMSDMTFYGVIQEIWELDYHDLTVILFKCDWVENNNGLKIDEFGFTTVDLNRIGHKSDSFILASQVKQVFYVKDPLNPRWSVVLTPPQRIVEEDFYEDEVGDIVQDCGYGVLERMPNLDVFQDDDEMSSTYARNDCEGIWVDK